MKTKDCVVGMGVYIKENFTSTLSEVKAYRDSRTPIYSNYTRATPLIVDAVQGDDAYIRGAHYQLSKVKIKDLMTIEEFALKQSELKVKSNELEEEFGRLELGLKDDILKAVKLISEVKGKCDEFGYTLSYLDLAHPLKEVVRDLGWTPSRHTC